MKPIIVFIFMLLLVPEGLSVCCPGPNCKDGTTVWTACGAGKSDFWHPFNGCDIFSCECRGGCREPKNIGECLKYCRNREWTCEEGCTGMEEACVEACKREQGRCGDRCQREFP